MQGSRPNKQAIGYPQHVSQVCCLETLTHVVGNESVLTGCLDLFNSVDAGGPQLAPVVDLSHLLVPGDCIPDVLVM